MRNRLRPLFCCAVLLTGFALAVGCGDEGNTVVAPDETETVIENPGLDIPTQGGGGGKGTS